MALTAGLLLDGASGLVLVAFGVLAALVRPARPTLAAFAVFAVVFGLRQINDNILRVLFDSEPLRLASVAAWLVAAAALVWFARAYLPRPERPASTVIAAVALGVAPLGLFTARSVAVGRVLWSETHFVANFVLLGAFFGVLALLALAAARAEDPAAGRLHAWLGVALVWWPAIDLGSWTGGTVRTSALWLPAGLLAVPALIALLWALAVRRGGKPALFVALALPLLAMLGQVLAYADARDSGAFGAARTISVALLAFAFARGGLLQGRLAIRRGTIATALLATALVVAQLAQSFLEAQYGLLAGGLIAGALLVAARPIERALEGRRATREPDAAKEEAFRAAVRMALRDRTITREEEIQLHRVAQHMGIPTGRAHELLVEVEKAEQGQPSARRND